MLKLNSWKREIYTQPKNTFTFKTSPDKRGGQFDFSFKRKQTEREMERGGV